MQGIYMQEGIHYIHGIHTNMYISQSHSHSIWGHIYKQVHHTPSHHTSHECMYRQTCTHLTTHTCTHTQICIQLTAHTHTYTRRHAHIWQHTHTCHAGICTHAHTHKKHIHDGRHTHWTTHILRHIHAGEHTQAHIEIIYRTCKQRHIGAHMQSTASTAVVPEMGSSARRGWGGGTSSFRLAMSFGNSVNPHAFISLTTYVTTTGAKSYHADPLLKLCCISNTTQEFYYIPARDP